MRRKTYRRFQMNFQKASDATNFIDAVRPVCPCKANPPAAPAAGLQNRSMTMAPKSSAPAQTAGPVQPQRHPSASKPLRPAMTMQPSRPPKFPGQRQIMEQGRKQSWGAPPNPKPTSAPTAVVTDPSTFTNQLSRAATCTPADTTSTPDTNFGRRTVTNLASSSALPIPVAIPVEMPSQDGSSQSTPAEPSLVAPAAHSAPPIVPTKSLSVSAPDIANKEPSVPSADSDVEMLPTPPLSVAAADPKAAVAHASSVPSVISPTAPPAPGHRDALLASLQQIPTLYDLSCADLENLVAHVVREEGFTQLVRRI